MTLRAFVARSGRQTILRGEARGGDPAELGRSAAGALLGQGAAALLGR